MADSRPDHAAAPGVVWPLFAMVAFFAVVAGIAAVLVVSYA
jgi:hypothetical protein